MRPGNFDFRKLFITILEMLIYRTYHRMTSRQPKKTSGSLLDSQEVAREQKRKMSGPDIIHIGDSKTRSQPIAIPSAAVSPIVSPHTDGNLLKIYYSH